MSGVVKKFHNHGKVVKDIASGVHSENKIILKKKKKRIQREFTIDH